MISVLSYAFPSNYSFLMNDRVILTKVCSKNTELMFYLSEENIILECSKYFGIILGKLNWDEILQGTRVVKLKIIRV